MPEAQKRAYRHPKYKTSYRIKNYLQSHAENAFCRFKRIIGGRLRAKNDDAQKREAAIGCAILNRMLEMGGPLSYEVG